ncbi:MAG: hypothetical protein JXQ71_01070 [Verrucomicrobia bacterium]|nr:hypothetical protein [Verrucomicrobiota bacterium]
MKPEIPWRVRFALPLLAAAASLAAADPLPSPAPSQSNDRADVRLLGRLAHPRLTESSGLVPSLKHPGLFWTHNDGGGARRQVLYAITREGAARGDCAVAGATLVDWEDLATDGAGRLYLGDVGNNHKRRTTLAVYEIDEPDPASQRVVRVTRGWQLRYPAEPFDCEALFVWQSHGYLVSKVFHDARARLYRFPLHTQPQHHTETCTLEEIATLPVESPVTGAALSADGQRLALVAKAGAYLLPICGHPARAGDLKPHRTKFKPAQIEGCCFVPEGLLATAESREIFLFTDNAFAAPFP